VPGFTVIFTSYTSRWYFIEKGPEQAGEWFGQQCIMYYFATLLSNEEQKDI
jgi:hypothetical protein